MNFKLSKKAFYLFTLGMLCAFAPMCTDMYLPALPSVMESYNTDANLVQTSLSASFLGLAIGQILIGPVSDAYGRLKPLYASLFIFVISSFLCAVAPNIYAFIGCRVLQGLSAAGGIVLTRSIACDRFKGNELTSFMAFLMSINSLAPILAPIAGSIIISFAPWQVLFYFLLIWGVGLMICTRLFVPESLAHDKRAPDIKGSLSLMKTDLMNPKFMMASISLACVMGGFFAYLSASPFVFQTIYGFTPFEYSLTFCFISICLSISGAISGRLSRKLGEVKVVYSAYALLLTSSALMIFEALYVPESFIYVLVTLTLFCSMMTLSQSAGFGLAMSAKKGGAGAASGIFGVLHFLTGVVTTPLAGLMGANSMLPLALCMFCCALLAAVFMKISRSLKD